MLYPKKQSPGFTLIELMVVIAIIGLLASTVLAALQDTRMLARDAKRVTEAKQMQNALELYRNRNNGLFPCAANANAGSGNCNHATTTIVGGLGGGISVFVGSGAKDTVLMSALSYIPTPESSFPAMVRYRPASQTDRSSYTILVWQEKPNDFCAINYGTGVSGWSGYSSC